MKIKDFLEKQNLSLGSYPKEYLEFEILLLVRSGSWVYGTNIETSDEDFRGIFIIPENYLYKLRNNYIPQISFGELNEKGDKKEDNCFYEIGRFMELLESSNPNVLEILQIVDENLLYKHPILNILSENKDKFLTKQCRNSVAGYAMSQISKATGQNKFQNWEESKMVRKSPLDFCNVYENQHSYKLIDWLQTNNLNQKNCGLVPVPHTIDKLENFIQYHVEDKDIWYSLSFHLSKQLQILVKYGLLDFDNFREEKVESKISYINDCMTTLKSKSNIEYNDVNEIANLFKGILGPIYKALKSDSGNKYKYIITYALFYDESNSKNYQGIVKEWEDGTIQSNELRLSSIPKNEKLKVIISYDMNGYSEHCKQWMSYQEWIKNRNETRYVDNKNHNQKIDSKNAMHLTRLLDMSKEIAMGLGMIVKRPNREYLLSIRRGEVSLQEIIDSGKQKIKEIDKLFNESNLPETIDTDYLNELLFTIRKNYYKNENKMISNDLIPIQSMGF
jgi:hypothetical protein